MAVLITLFLLTWIQGFIEIQTTQTQTQGIHQETSQVAISTGSIMNTFQALNPQTGDYSEAATLRIKNMLEPVNSTLTKNQEDNQITVTTFYGDNQATYSYPVHGNTTYQENCSNTGGKPCVKK